MTRLISISDAIEKGISKLRHPAWKESKDHVAISSVDGMVKITSFLKKDLPRDPKLSFSVSLFGMYAGLTMWAPYYDDEMA